MKRRMQIYFIILCLVVIFYRTSQAEIAIWQIGGLDDSFSEFIFADSNIIEYNVPQDWELLIGQSGPNWGEFPAILYPFGDPNNVPNEIRINFDYPEEYSCLELKIRAATQSNDPNIRLKLFKGEIFIGEKPMENRIIFFSYDFSMGYVKKGFHEENSFIIGISGPSNTSIYFDNISLYSNDSDGDGVCDIDEGDCSLDMATACIPINGSDPNSSDKKKIILHVDELEDATPRFRNVKFLDPNTLNITEWLLSDSFLPYGFLSFKIEEIDPYDNIGIQISYVDPYINQLYPSAHFYAYQDSNTWDEMDFTFLDGNTALIPLHDGGEEDFDGEKNGAIHTILVLSYPKSLYVNIERGECFLKAIHI